MPYLFITALVSIFIPYTAAAVAFENPIFFTAIFRLLEAFVQGVIYIAVPFFGAFLVWTGLLFVSAQGDPEKIKRAKDMFVKIVIGGAIILAAWTIANIAGSTIAGLGTAATLIVLGGFLLYALVFRSS